MHNKLRPYFKTAIGVSLILFLFLEHPAKSCVEPTPVELQTNLITAEQNLKLLEIAQNETVQRSLLLVKKFINTDFFTNHATYALGRNLIPLIVRWRHLALEHHETETAVFTAKYRLRIGLEEQKPAVSDLEEDYRPGVEQWRGLVAIYFPKNLVNEALTVMWCESRGLPDATSKVSDAKGLFQHKQKYWLLRAEGAGFGEVSIYNPEANIAAAAWLVKQSISHGKEPWEHWACKPNP